ncbi:CDP-diacylglycerol--glycerol-3-phosphate 3-phosphatidyltransferase [Pseudochrobactrum saccharolyticum]|uniref:CDP-diacylglycerol--glycerol-3-phosphate 3-phosphatidyltransferase n=1 Tax=Pseudochrobactrum saccharolyticum TaxID=354352 RepID=A0A7W8EQY1_9HYPH|nr:CDP-alcohol phosphatidyltransferase family protein [Pseudochrobactrum saccharolyticum]KAB0537379.1 CDP-alcohol phosphatidyltransferase family protein [Pseudochrobactrum saccharolyticum]MBB5092128.1 CDP-diacylglycerol--glycerol-3-phosphate 3-phosphatidyltransferase [Pseudochrobactrum saccharolyticum]
MSVYQLKSRFQDLLRPLVSRLAQWGVTANQVTVAAMLISVAVGSWLVIAENKIWFWLIPVWLFIRMAMNAIDGMLAREFNQQSALGAYLNELGDLVSDIALFTPFLWIAPFQPHWMGLIIVLALLTEFAGLLGLRIGASRRYDGPMGKSDRALLFGILGGWLAVDGFLPQWMVWLQPLLIALLMWTIFNRIRRGLAEAAKG